MFKLQREVNELPKALLSLHSSTNQGEQKNANSMRPDTPRFQDVSNGRREKFPHPKVRTDGNAKLDAKRREARLAEDEQGILGREEPNKPDLSLFHLPVNFQINPMGMQSNA